MSPKEKAQELYDKYHEVLYDSMNILWKEEAKTCALIAADEVKATVPIDGTLMSKFKIKWWGWVKEEIEKL